MLSKNKKRVLICLLNLFTKYRFEFRYKGEFYSLIDQERRHFFLPTRAHLYLAGSTYRSIKLGKSYGLQNVNFETNDIVIDVGANNGDLQEFLRDCNYFGFEPAPKEFELLVLNRLNKSLVYKLACGNVDANSTFFISTDMADSSLIKPKFFTEKILVRQIRLDSFFHGDEIKLLKIDAEGAEIEVLNGCQGILDFIEFIAIDAGLERGVNSDLTAPSVFDFLYLNNFHLIDVPSHNRFLFQHN